VNAGGDIYCLGRGPEGRGWRVGIKNPRADSLIGILKVSDRAVATSGDYERFHIVDGNRYSHIIDPRTGYALSGTPMSVTVVADDCATADGLATAVFVEGPAGGMAMAREAGVDVIIISKDGASLKTEMTDGAKEIFEAFQE
jgi:thiamine biosynthesis lipoprotein